MRLLQTQDVARRLGVATSTVRRWAAEGMLPYRWAGSYRVFEPEEVRRLASKLKAARTGESGSRRRGETPVPPTLASRRSGGSTLDEAAPAISGSGDSDGEPAARSVGDVQQP